MPIPDHGLGEAINDRLKRAARCNLDRQRRSSMTPEPRALQAPSDETLDALVRIVGEDHAVRDEEAMTPYLVEWRDRYRGKAALVLKPGSTAEVAAILKRANETRTAIVPQGGNTGLVGGADPVRKRA